MRQLDLDGTSSLSDPVEVDLLTQVNDVEVAPHEFILQNYPNPFNPSTEVKFAVSGSGFATLEVFNILGEKVSTLFAGSAEAGKYYVLRFDAPNLSGGVYFFRLQSEGQLMMRKMVLLK